MVSSTTPRFGPRCPPVRATASIRNSRISVASTPSWAASSVLRSAGVPIDLNSSTGGVYVSQSGHPPLTAKRPFDQVDGMTGRAQAVSLVLIRGRGGLDDVGGDPVPQLHPDGAQARVGRGDSGIERGRRKPGEHQGLTPQDVVPAVV